MTTRPEPRAAIKAEVTERTMQLCTAILAMADTDDGLIPMEQMTSALMDVFDGLGSAGTVKAIRLNPEIIIDPVCVGKWDSERRLRSMEVVHIDDDLSEILENH